MGMFAVNAFLLLLLAIIAVVGAAFQGLVFLVLLGMGRRLQATTDSAPASVMISSAAGAVTEAE